MTEHKILQTGDIKNKALALYVADCGLEKQAEALCRQTGLPLTTDLSTCKTALVLSADGLSLCRPGDPEMKGRIRVDFTTPAWKRRLKGVRSELLIKAMGRRTCAGTEITDATGGLGRDSFLLAAAGFQVQVFECNPVLAALLMDGIQRAARHRETKAICNRIHCIPENAVDFLYVNKPAVDIMYLDPMFPKKNSSAKVKKELQLIQQIVGEDQDEAKLFTCALQTAVNRVVVKRSCNAPWLENVRPAYSLTGKIIRFDIYLPPFPS